MENKRVKLGELKLPLVRKVIEFGERQIEVYNVTEESRERWFKRLHEANDNKKSMTELDFDVLYTDFLNEFTDLEIDATSLKEILEAPSSEFLELKGCIDTMLYELALEELQQVIAMNRNKIIVAMTEIATREAELGDELVNDHEKIVANGKTISNEDNININLKKGYWIRDYTIDYDKGKVIINLEKENNNEEDN